MLIYSTEITPRLSYACEVLFKPWNIRWEITNDFTFFETVSGPKINYSKTESRPGSITLHPLPLLFEKGISKQPANLFYRDEIPSFFQSSSQSIPFDLFAATFYLASRYEEYQHFEKDFMGRFEAGNSSSHQLGFLRLPLIDIWRKRLGEELEKLWPDQPFRTEGFSALSTIDVDSAFAYKHKGLIRIAGGYAKDFTGFRFCNMANRTSALLGATKDPYDTYDFIIAEYQRTGIPLHFFFLLADFGKFDKNVSHTSRRLRALIRSINADHAVGIHPGIGSHEDIAVLKKEINRLSEITGKPVTSSRLHYLKFSLPETYRHLYECGITDDYSMGYASDVGFRAGTSLPFRWYDVKKETVTPLVIHPFVCMDATFKNYLKIRQAEAEKQIRDLLYEVKKTNGRFVSLWHNESLADSKEWAGYKNLYSAMLNMAQ